MPGDVLGVDPGLLGQHLEELIERLRRPSPAGFGTPKMAFALARVVTWIRSSSMGRTVVG